MIAMLALSGPVDAETSAAPALAAPAGGEQTTDSTTSAQAIATNVQFDSSFLPLEDSQNVDLSRYATGVELSTDERMNNITIDPKGASDDVEMVSTEKKVAPYFGAVVKVEYGTKKGTPVLINATYQGEPLPFGAQVLDEDGRSVGAAGQGGQVYARVEKTRGALTVRWGTEAAQSCTLNYHLMQTGGQQANALQTFTMPCAPVAGQSSKATKLLAMQDASTDSGA